MKDVSLTHTCTHERIHTLISQSWDDVERRVRPPEKPYDFSRSRPLQQEQSKLSLAEVYEQEYVKQTQVRE